MAIVRQRGDADFVFRGDDAGGRLHTEGLAVFGADDDGLLPPLRRPRDIAFVEDAALDCLSPCGKVFSRPLASPEPLRGVCLSYKKTGALLQVRRDFIEFMKTGKPPLRR